MPSEAPTTRFKPSSLPSEVPSGQPTLGPYGYDEGPCLQWVFTNRSGSTYPMECDYHNDVVDQTSFTWEGPTSCFRGETILVNISATIQFLQMVEDFASYTSLDGGDAVDGERCALSAIDPAYGDADPNLQDLDGDTCLDVPNAYIMSGYHFRENLQITCNGNGTGVQVENCFTWSSAGSAIDTGSQYHCYEQGYVVPNDKKVSPSSAPC